MITGCAHCLYDNIYIMLICSSYSVYRGSLMTTYIMLVEHSLVHWY